MLTNLSLLGQTKFSLDDDFAKKFNYETFYPVEYKQIVDGSKTRNAYMISIDKPIPISSDELKGSFNIISDKMRFTDDGVEGLFLENELSEEVTKYFEADDSNVLLVENENTKKLYMLESSILQSMKNEKAKIQRSISDRKTINDLMRSIGYKPYAFLGLRSIFPAVEDNSLLFLTKVVEDLSLEQQERLFEDIQRGGTDDYEIEWHEGIPFKGSEDGSFENLFFKLPDDDISIISEKLSNSEFPSSYQIWGYIKTVRGEDIDINSFKILLQVKEAFIRAEIMRKVLKNTEILDKDFTEFLFQDEHPTVIFNLISSIIQNWFNFSDELKSLFKDLMIKSFNKIDVAIRAYGVIATFSVDYGSESIVEWTDFDEEQTIELWNLWGEIYPYVVNNIPLKIYLNGARFISTISTAIKYIKLENGMGVFNAWYKRLDYQISENQIIEEYEMSIMIDLLRLTNDNFEIRENIFTALINYNNTNFLLSNLKWALIGWRYLVESEKQQISDLLEIEREDLRWIRAVILTSETPPTELVGKILGDGDFFNKDIRDFISEIPENLLLDCLNVFCGTPRTLSSLALHNNNRDFWFNVMQTILLNESNSSFKICLEDFLIDGVNGSTEKWGDWKNLWETICSTSQNKNYLFQRLLFNTSRCSCNITTTKKLWTILIENYKSSDELSVIKDLIIENIEILQQTGHKEDIFKFFDKDFFNELFYEIFPDNKVYQVLRSIKDNEDLGEIGLLHIKGHIKQCNTRVFITFDYAKKVLNTSNQFHQEIISILEIQDKERYKKGSENKKKLDIYNYKLDNWIGIN